MWGRAISGAGEVLGDSQNAGGCIWGCESTRAGGGVNGGGCRWLTPPVGWGGKERNKNGAKRPFFFREKKDRLPLLLLMKEKEPPCSRCAAGLDGEGLKTK